MNKYIVHWPGKSVVSCDKHKDHLKNLASVMGFQITATEYDGDEECANCKRNDLAGDEDE